MSHTHGSMMALALALSAAAAADSTAEAMVIEAGNGRVARRAPNLLHEHEVDALKQIVSDMEADETKLDSTDRLPAYETYARNMGEDKYPEVRLGMKSLWERMTTYAKDTYESCPDCFLCDVLLRRYRQDERTRVHSHFDRNALVTAVVNLNGGSDPPAYEGGFFLQRTERASSREFLDANKTDAIFHDYGLNHGVDVQKGERYSAVFWFSDNAASCKEGRSPWYDAPAAAGDMNAQEALAELYQLGSSGYERNVPKAAELFRLASEQGSAAAQSKLGRLLLAGEGTERDPVEGMRWVKAAAEQGFAPAEHTMGVACQYGDAEGGLEGAVSWFRKAAEAGIASSQYELGAAYVNGDGVDAGMVTVGAYWLRRAAAQGNKEALSDLAELRTNPDWLQVEEVAKQREIEGIHVSEWKDEL